MMKVLVTGGAGFIGSHLVDGLIERGYTVRVFDNLDPQVHGAGQKVPVYLNPEAEFTLGDMRDREALARALDGVQAVFHQAAAVGVGQSMYKILHYMDHNALGTANLLDLLASGAYEIEKLIVASSMSIYGEGKYQCQECGIMFPQLRSEAQLRERRWEIHCPNCLAELQPLATDEEKPLFPTSIYAISKRDQEEMCLSVGRAYGIPTVALRYFNTYGPRQALSNPYTGVAVIFCTRILNGNPSLIFEDGLQSRDFVHVKDIVQANLLVLENPNADYQVFNVGTGRPLAILDLARILLDQLGRPDLEPQIVQRFRAGDIRHCYADISRIQAIGYTPQTSLEEGISDLIQWVTKQPKALDQTALAVKQLDHRGLIR
jgi:dTDP-L-rhamnose 4-epimerase